MIISQPAFTSIITPHIPHTPHTTRNARRNIYIYIFHLVEALRYYPIVNVVIAENFNPINTL
jgi:hypothetical protein